MSDEERQTTDLSIYHERPLRRAREKLEHAVLLLADAESTLAAAGVPARDRAVISTAQMDVFELQSWIRTELRRTELHASAIAAVPPPPVTGAAPDVTATPAAPAPPTPAPPAPLAVHLLFGPGMTADLENEFGQTVTVRLRDVKGARIEGHAARQTLVPGVRVTGRFVDLHAYPWRITMECHEAIERDDETFVVLGVSEIAGDDQRRDERLAIEASVTLSALGCSALRDGDEVRGQIVNLSSSGMGFATAETLKSGDRLRFHARLFEGVIDGEVRVASVRPSGGSNLVGSWFTGIDPASRQVLEDVLGRRRGGAPGPAPVSYAKLRGMLSEPSGRGPLRRRSTLGTAG
jgi:PilZ domain